MLDQSHTVECLTLIHQPTLEYNKNTVCEYILALIKDRYTLLLSPALGNACVEWLFKVYTSDIFSPLTD